MTFGFENVDTLIEVLLQIITTNYKRAHTDKKSTNNYTTIQIITKNCKKNTKVEMITNDYNKYK